MNGEDTSGTDETNETCPSAAFAGTPNDEPVTVTRVELETLVARVEALEEALDALAERD